MVSMENVNLPVGQNTTAAATVKAMADSVCAAQTEENVGAVLDELVLGEVDQPQIHSCSGMMFSQSRPSVSAVQNWTINF